MNISEVNPRSTPDRVAVLHLRAHTFEEERILTAIRDAITKGGSMEIVVPGNGDDEHVMNCSFGELEEPRE